MIRELSEGDIRDIAGLWGSFYPSRYRVDEAQIRVNTCDCAVFDWGATVLSRGPEGELRGFALVKKSASPRLWRGSDVDQAHLSAVAFTEPEVGIDMLAQVKRVLQERGANRLVFGQDARHFFPGCPEDFPGLRDFLMVEGFETGGECCDLECDLAKYKNPAKKTDAEMRVLSKKDVAGLERFFDREFPGRWKSDTLSKVQAEGPEAVFGLFLKGEIEGFALIQHWADKMPIGGAVWHMDLGEKWGALGPIGVSAGVRGHGYGDAVLGGAIEHLRGLGVGRMIIDWTGLVKFYGRHGFEATRKYQTLALNLETVRT